MEFPKPAAHDKTFQDMALVLGLHCVRNTIIEDYHAEGKLSDPEMMAFNKEVVNLLYTYLQLILNPYYQEQYHLLAKNPLFLYKPHDWDIPTFDEGIKQYILSA